ncbi:hypothetical protein LPW11_06590 [Geomonas sp. RF6]|uniref:hypothetical protein n=1 Tax=Geomonas sp. RF6 TaxID=2897342 RepID=UPI001E64FD19|nr:hypothetical protein [Geomonas sp. RF6]UFS71856.1 hypothetical protein LPW11_06590 [Geomonas sp. RF6]
MPIYLGPTEHLDQPENLMGNGPALRAKLKSYMERQSNQQHLTHDLDSHRTRLDATPRRNTAMSKRRF